MGKRRICCFCETWESGGIESFLNNMLCRMDLSDLEVDIVAAELRPSVFTRELQTRGVCFLELSGNVRKLGENYALFRRLLRERRYDVVHFNLFQGLSLRYVKIAKQEGVPCRIAHSHNTALRKSPARALKLLLHRAGSRLYASCATEKWACSGDAAAFLFGKAAEYTFIPNGIETERFRFSEEKRNAVRAQLNLENCFVVGNVGRLCYQKNQMFLLDVLAELQKSRPEARLLLVGEGEDRQALKEKAEALGLSAYVIFYGVSKNVEELFCAMDAFAFPSRFEGLGIVAVEAQAAGLAVLCSRDVPAEAILTGQAQQLPPNAEIWAKALLMTQSADRQESADLVKTAGFDVENVSEYIAKAYMEN